MKKMIIFLQIFLILFVMLPGCRSSQPVATTQAEEVTAPSAPSEPDVCSFADIEWTRTTENCTETLCFRSNGDCSYYCACGNPVNDDDLCQGYRYDGKTQTIYLHFSETTEETVTQIALKKWDDKTLTLDFNGDLRTFQKAEKQEEIVDKLTYDGEKYVYLQFPGDIFYYDLKDAVECEEDEVVPVRHSKWKFVYREGDLYVLDAHKGDAAGYFSKDSNYTWAVVIDDPETEKPIVTPVSVTAEDLAYIYSMEGMKRERTLLFDDIELFASLVKTDKAGFISASASLAYHNGNWYWRSEIIDDSVEGWPEYVVNLPDSITKQISAIYIP